MQSGLAVARRAVHILMRTDLRKSAIPRGSICDSRPYVSDHRPGRNVSRVVVELDGLYHSVVANRTNEVMKMLTIFTTIFIPLTFIVGVYGMNFDRIAGTAVAGIRYYVVWAIMLVVAGGCLVLQTPRLVAEEPQGARAACKWGRAAAAPHPASSTCV